MSIDSVCRDMLHILNTIAANPSNAEDVLMWCEKARGDYYRYLSEIWRGEFLAKAAKSYDNTMRWVSSAPPADSGMAERVLVHRYSAALNLAILLSAFFYVVPILGARRAMASYRVAVGCALLLYALSLFAKHPLKFATLRDPAVTGSHEAQLVFLTFMMLVSPPLQFVVVPFAAYAVHSVATNYGALVHKLPGALKAVLETPEVLLVEGL